MSIHDFESAPGPRDSRTAVPRERTPSPGTWCSRHTPARSEQCPYHQKRWDELHDDEIKRDFWIGAIFYCSHPGCDRFDWDSSLSSGIRSCLDDIALDFLERVRFAVGGTLRSGEPGKEQVATTTRLFISEVRLKILFYKQRLNIASE